MMRTLYTLLGIFLTPALSLWLFKRAERGKEDRSRLRERFGYSETPRPTGTLVWLHAASVGEAQSVLTLVRALLARGEALHVLVTTGTVTSATMIARASLPRVIHQYIPLDTYPAARRFLHHWQPSLALWVESEFWPQLLWQIRRHHIPMLLVNARMSARSHRGWKRWPRLIRSVLSCFDTVYAGSAEDATRLRELGATEVIEAGNLKFDAAPLAVDETQITLLQTASAGRPHWLAASTHANEELMVSQAHQALVAAYPTLLTIVVPRHATRGDAIAADLRARGLTVAQRSKREPITAATHIYLADTMGELGTFYHFSPIVFLGGSLIAHGGQNPLEPARMHCALVTGEHTHNFASMMPLFEAAGALRRVSNAAQLAATIGELLANEPARTAMQNKAFEVVQQSQGATATILAAITTLLGGS